MQKRLLVGGLGLLGVLLVCGLFGLYLLSYLPQPQQQPDWWTARASETAQIAATSRLFGFFTTVTFGPTCACLPVLLIGLLLLYLFLRAANG